MPQLPTAGQIPVVADMRHHGDGPKLHGPPEPTPKPKKRASKRVPSKP